MGNPLVNIFTFFLISRSLCDIILSLIIEETYQKIVFYLLYPGTFLGGKNLLTGKRQRCWLPSRLWRKQRLLAALVHWKNAGIPAGGITGFFTPRRGGIIKT